MAAIIYRKPVFPIHRQDREDNQQYGCGEGRSHVRPFHMSWAGDGGEGAGGDRDRRGYHHGTLREALTRAALDLIAAKGPAGFTFAEAARSAGVSPAAPYRHFRDRDALMADVARRGFELF